MAEQQQMEIDIVREAWSIAEEAMGPGMTDEEVEKLLDSPCGAPAQLSPAQAGSVGPVTPPWTEAQRTVAIREISQYMALRTYEGEMPPNHDVRVYDEEGKEFARQRRAFKLAPCQGDAPHILDLLLEELGSEASLANVLGSLALQPWYRGYQQFAVAESASPGPAATLGVPSRKLPGSASSAAAKPGDSPSSTPVVKGDSPKRPCHVCQTCGMSITTRDGLLRHWQQRHAPTFVGLACPVKSCIETFANSRRNELRKHLAAHHEYTEKQAAVLARTLRPTNVTSKRTDGKAPHPPPICGESPPATEGPSPVADLQRELAELRQEVSDLKKQREQDRNHLADLSRQVRRSNQSGANQSGSNRHGSGSHKSGSSKSGSNKSSKTDPKRSHKSDKTGDDRADPRRRPLNDKN